MACAQAPRLKKKKKKTCMWGDYSTPREPETWEESKYLLTGGRDKRASGWDRKKGRNTLPLSLCETPLPLSRLVAPFRQSESREFPRREEQSKPCHSSCREQSHIQVLGRVRGSSEKAVDGNGRSDPCMMAPWGPYPWGMELVTRSNHCV